MSDHDYCRCLLSHARAEAKSAGVEIPKRLTALPDSRRRDFFIEGDGVKGEYVSGDCSWSARARYIYQRVDAASEAKP